VPRNPGLKAGAKDRAWLCWPLIPGVTPPLLEERRPGGEVVERQAAAAA